MSDTRVFSIRRIILSTTTPIRVKPIKLSFPHPHLLVSKLPASEDKKLSFSDKTEPREVSVAVSTELRLYAGQRWPTMNHKWRKARLASLLGMNERRVKSLYEGDPSARIRQDEISRIEALVSARRGTADAADRALSKRVAELEANLARVVAALARNEVAASRMEGRVSRIRIDAAHRGTAAGGTDNRRN